MLKVTFSMDKGIRSSEGIVDNLAIFGWTLRDRRKG